MTEQPKNGADAFDALTNPVDVEGDERALPLPKLEDEAVALLTACNSILNSLALQGVNIPKRLLTDLTLFCRDNPGFQIPFPKLATMVVKVSASPAPADQIQALGYDLFRDGQELRNLTVDLAVAGRAGQLSLPATRRLLELAGEMELRTERLYQFFGWNKMLVRQAARQKLDADAAKKG